MTKKLEKYIVNQIIAEWSLIAEQTLVEAKPREMQIEFLKRGAIALIEDPRLIEYKDSGYF